MAQVNLTFVNDVFTNPTYGVANYSGTVTVDYTTNTFSGSVTITGTPAGTLSNIAVSGTVAPVGGAFTLSGAGIANTGFGNIPFALTIGYTGTNPTFTDTVTGTATTPLGVITYSTANNAPPNSTTQPVSSSAVCFAAGTLISTGRGEVAVENLAVGDLVVTSSGKQRPVR